MKNGAQVGLAVAAGYVLGRFHKVKWAMALAALGAGKRLPGVQGELLDRGKKLLSATSASSTLTGEMRSHLVEAGKSAAVTAVSNRIDSISDSLRERSDTMRGAGDQEPDEEESGSRSAGRRTTRGRKSPATRSTSRASGSSGRTRRSSSGSRPSSDDRSGSGSQARAKTSSRTRKSTSSSDTGTNRKSASSSGSGTKKSSSSGQRSASSRSGGESR